MGRASQQPDYVSLTHDAPSVIHLIIIYNVSKRQHDGSAGEGATYS